ncbi:TRAP transporter small permease subunit [uncultured Rhodoferax sp.]|uniref:TRAP transporter small permease subunit n=1 Tax=uncultured Rhodoferax sp. TaxID=223188 RepID=UPI0025DE691F|nr:TRAP transporter small permease subunit [uncultured Rhodoferax sp.]
MNAGFAFALRAADLIDRVNRQLAMWVRWGLLANALLIAGNAISRKFFGVASSSLYDVQPHFFAAAVLLMAAYTFKRDEHVRIDVFAGHLGPRGMAWLDLAGIALVLLPLCVTAVWVTWPQFVASYATGETRASRESLSQFPAWVMKGIIPLGFITLGAQGMAEGVRCVAFLAGVAARPRAVEYTDRRGYT